MRALWTTSWFIWLIPAVVICYILLKNGLLKLSWVAWENVTSFFSCILLCPNSLTSSFLRVDNMLNAIICHHSACGAFIPRWNKHVLAVQVLSGFLTTPNVWECCRCLIKLDWNFRGSSQVSPMFRLSNGDNFLVALYIAVIFTLKTSVSRVILFSLL